MLTLQDKKANLEAFKRSVGVESTLYAIAVTKGHDTNGNWWKGYTFFVMGIRPKTLTLHLAGMGFGKLTGNLLRVYNEDLHALEGLLERSIGRAFDVIEIE